MEGRSTRRSQGSSRPSSRAACVAAVWLLAALVAGVALVAVVALVAAVALETTVALVAAVASGGAVGVAVPTNVGSGRARERGRAVATAVSPSLRRP